MNKNDLKDLTSKQERAMDILADIFKLQRIIASNQITIISKLRKIHSMGFMSISDELGVQGIAKFENSKCQVCGIQISGAYEYNRSTKLSNRCTGCEDSETKTLEVVKATIPTKRNIKVFCSFDFKPITLTWEEFSTHKLTGSNNFFCDVSCDSRYFKK